MADASSADTAAAAAATTTTTPAVDKTQAGWEHYEDYGNGFHERLGAHWPDDREQLHCGGVHETQYMVQQMGWDYDDTTNVDDTDEAAKKEKKEQVQKLKILELCSGEGATAIALGEKLGLQITGIDIVSDAVELSNRKAEERGVSDCVKFVRCNAFQMPFEDASFDAAFGQDPDAFSHTERLALFKEILRVMRPGAKMYFTHHWIAGPAIPMNVLHDFEAFQRDLGWRALDGCHAMIYDQQLREAGWEVLRCDDIGDMAAAHLRGAGLEHYKQHGKIQDKWLERILELMRQGHRFGARFIVQKPM